MAHSVLDQLEFEALTGMKLDDDQSDRYHSVASVAVAEMESLLGWPLIPDDWENQYLEIGKSTDDSSCPAVDADGFADEDPDEELDAPDAVVGKYRLFTLKKGDPFLFIDPATAIHAVKFIQDGVTRKSYESDEYIVRTQNGNPSVIRYLGIKKLMCACVRILADRQFAVDADWAYETIPTELKKILADTIAGELDPKSDIKSESVISHSYTKFDRSAEKEKQLVIIRKYAGPHGSVTRSLT